MWVRTVVLALLVGGCDVVFGLSHEPLPPDAGPLPTTRWLSVTGGAAHSCGIRIDQTLWCWGRNDAGELGTGSEVELDAPTQVGSDTWTVVSASSEHTCGVKTDGTLWCWGDNQHGQLGNGTALSAPVPTQVLGSWKTVATGPFHTCAIDSTSAMQCWGTDTYGEIGDNQPGSPDHLSPTPTATGTWTAVTTGNEYSCGLQSNGTLWCWGGGGDGGLGDGGPATIPAPAQIGTDLWQSVTAHNQTTCGLRSDGKLRCWGFNDSGQVGDDAVDIQFAPTPLAGVDAAWAAIATGAEHTCGIRADGSLWCWGSNRAGQLATVTTDPFSTTPVMVSAGPWLALGLGERHTCAIDPDHQLWCAGLNGGQLGTADGGSRTTPVKIGPAGLVAAGGVNSCLVDPQLHLQCWGFNGFGAVGDNSTSDRAIPTRTTVQANGAWTKIAIGDHVCAIDQEGSFGHLRCWGYNVGGQIGNNSTTNAPTAVEIIPPNPNDTSGWVTIAADQHTCAVDVLADLACWGSNDYGRDGTDPGQTPDPLKPVDVSSTPYSELAAGGNHTCGVGPAGLDCWGDNQFGQLGDGSGGARSQAMQVILPAGTPVGVTAGDHHTCVRVNTQAYCWGENTSGQLGDQTVDGKSTPVLIDGAWQQLAAGFDFTCGIHTDGTLACWGANESGQLGDGTRRPHHEPQPVGSDTDWTSVTAGSSHVCARKQNGDVYCWGRNLEGQVGDGGGWRTRLVVVP